MAITVTGYQDQGADLGNDGKFLDTIRWTMTQANDKTFRAFQREKDPKTDEWVKTEKNLTKFPMSILIDFENAEFAWIHAADGIYDCQAQRISDIASSGQALPRPSPDHSAGFRVKVYNDKLFSGVRYFAGTSKFLKGRVDALHDQWMKEKDAHPKMAPLVRITGKEEIDWKGSNYYPPVWEIADWKSADVFPQMAKPLTHSAEKSPDTPQEVIAGSPPPADNAYGADDFA